MSREDSKTPQFVHFLGLMYKPTGDRQRAADTMRRARDLAAPFGQSDMVRTIDGHTSQWMSHYSSEMSARVSLAAIGLALLADYNPSVPTACRLPYRSPLSKKPPPR